MKSIYAVFAGMLLAGRVASAHPGHDLASQIAMDEQFRLQNKVSITIQDGYRVITSNAIPDHKPGQFPNPGNPNRISEQNYHFRMPVAPKVGAQITPLMPMLFGVAVNGVVFDPSTAEFWNGDRRAGWNFEALTGKLNLGTDANNAHVQPDGAYHYHGVPLGLVVKLQKPNSMTLVGWAADGFPIYAALGHAQARDAKSALWEMRPSYRLKSGTRPSGNDGPGGAYDGTFTKDYEYVAGSGDLDECNGRFGVTPEFPGGTYHYFLTEQFPFVPRYFRGTPDPSFRHGPPNGSRNGGPNGRGPNGNRRGPGFGPPPGDFGPPFGPPPF